MNKIGELIRRKVDTSWIVERPRRLRQSAAMRDLVRENRVNPEGFIQPLFVIPGTKTRQPIASMPGIDRLSIDETVRECRELWGLGVRAVLLFGIPDEKDAHATSNYDPNGLIQTTTREIKNALPELLVAADLCNCEYTDHGHCGIVGENGDVDNDRTLEILVLTALTYAKAGVDIIAPSDMMDGRIGAMRRALDADGYHRQTIMSYASKYASAFYGPFREAADSTPAFGDRRTYQMDPANAREAVREALLDIDEGADIVMVKPALAYMDIIRQVRDAVDRPVATYNVSGEYAMVKAAAERGWIDEAKIVDEMLVGFARAGADIVITYFAKDYLRRHGA